MKVLVDTSVWVSHFQKGEPGLVNLLQADRVLLHPLVRIELACGTPPQRQRTLQLLSLLQVPSTATTPELLLLIERERLHGQGCGAVDLGLLASTLLSPGTRLWTLDKRLKAVAERRGVAYRPASDPSQGLH